MAFRQCLFLVVFVYAVIGIYGTATTSKDTSAETTDDSSDKVSVCEGRTPCGWAVYDRYSRYIEHFMKNRCLCPEGKICIRHSDDISITAYVYRCMVKEASS